MRTFCVVLGCLAGAASAAAAPTGVHYDLDVTVDAERRTLEGDALITVTSAGAEPLSELWLWRYPARLGARAAKLNDYNFHWVYPGSFSPAAFRETGVTVNGQPVQATPADHPLAGRGTLLKVPLDPPLASGRRVELAVHFQVDLPKRFGRFGCFRGTCTLEGGFHPMVAAFAKDGRQDLSAPPARASYRLTVHVPQASDVVAGGELRVLPKGGALTVERPEAAAASLVVGRPRLRTVEAEHGGVKVVLYTRAARPVPSPAGALVPYWPPDREGRILRTVNDALDLVAEAGFPMPAGETVRLVEGALRIEVAEALPDFILVSDQIFAILPFERFLKFHEFELARALYRAFVERRVAARERSDDLGWSPEVAAAALVDRYTVRSYQRAEWAGQILKWASFIPAIDRILYAPQVPFASAYFYTLEDSDPLRDSLAQFANDRPQGKLIYAKLRDLLGDAGVSEVARRQLEGEPLRQAAEAVRGAPLDWFFSQWLGPYPRVDYRFAEVRSERRADRRWHHVVVVEKRGARPPVEPVELEARDKRGHVLQLRWDGTGARHAYEFDTEAELGVLEIDPRGRLVEDLPGSNDDLRFDDRRPPRWKFIYNNFGALVNVFPTFSLDLSLDFSLQPILDLKNSIRFDLYNSQATDVGLVAQYTRSFGRKVTPARLTQAIATSLTLARLNASFGRSVGSAFPGTRLVAGVGYGYDDRLFVWEPSRALSLSAGGSYALTALDSGTLLSQATVSAGWESIWRLADDHSLAMQLSAGVTFGDLRVPAQMLSAGGASGLRGYGVGELLGRARILGRVEWRHVFVHWLDVNLVEALYLRGIGGGLFVEGAAVSECGSYAISENSLAADAGYSLRVFADWLGVSQTTLNLDFAVPILRPLRSCFGSPFHAGAQAPIGFYFAFGAPW